MKKLVAVGNKTYQCLTVTVDDRKGVLVRELGHMPADDFIIFQDEPDKAVKDHKVLRQAKFEGGFIFRQEEE